MRREVTSSIIGKSTVSEGSDERNRLQAVEKGVLLID
jgi:hypothetical protein